MSEHPRIRPPIGSTEELRDYIADQLTLAVVYAQHGADLARIGDDRGIEMNVRKLIAYVKAAAATLPDLRSRRCST